MGYHVRAHARAGREARRGEGKVDDMVKSRFTSLDVRAMVLSLQQTVLQYMDVHDAFTFMPAECRRKEGVPAHLLERPGYPSKSA